MLTLATYLFRHSRVRFFIATGTAVVTGVTNVLLIGIITNTIGNIGGGRARLIWTYAAVLVCWFGCGALSQLILANLSLELAYTFRRTLCRQVCLVPLRSLERLGSGGVFSSIVNDVDSITTAVSAVPQFFMNAAIVMGCFLYLTWLCPPALLIMSLFTAAGCASYQWPVRRARVHLKLARDSWDSLNEHVRALNNGAKELRLNESRREAFLAGNLQPVLESLRYHLQSSNTTFVICMQWARLLVYVLIGIFVFIFPYIAHPGVHVLTGLVLTILYFTGPMQGILNAIPVQKQAGVALDRLRSTGLSLTSAPVQPIAPIRSEWQSLVLDEVCYSYETNGEDRFTLGPLSISIIPGEILFVVGGNGSGKTTLAKLFVGLYKPQRGEIRLDGTVITDDNRTELRSIFSAIFSDSHLFNAPLGAAPASRSEIEAYIEKLALKDAVSIENGQFSTTELSQGQRKRLSLLTAYLEKRPIYVFDEWAADQEPAFRDFFYTTILQELKQDGRTAVVITHDDRYFSVADRLIRLDCGKLADGSPPEAKARSTVLEKIL